jgi:hypothetical protein
MTRESKKVGQVPILPHIGTYSLFIGYSQPLRQNELPSMTKNCAELQFYLKIVCQVPARQQTANRRGSGTTVGTGT